MATQPAKPRRQDYVLFGQGPHGIGYLDATGLRFHGMTSKWSLSQLHALDVRLDSLDPCNEDPSEAIPGWAERKAARVARLAELADGSLPA